jgi:hypothetical protein
MMRWFLPGAFLSALLLASAVPAATACINDREAETHEREFKSQYLKQPPAPSTEQPPASIGDHVGTIAMSGLGVSLLAGAVVFSLKGVTHRR